jgi:hypothetical protein
MLCFQENEKELETVGIKPELLHLISFHFFLSGRIPAITLNVSRNVFPSSIVVKIPGFS